MQLIIFLLLSGKPTQQSLLYKNLEIFRSKQPSASAYAGTWIGRTANSEFKLVLEEHKNYKMADGQKRDAIIGRHSFFNKDVRLNSETLSKPIEESSLFGIIAPGLSHQLSAVFTDEATSRSYNVSLSFAQNSTNKLVWRITGRNEYHNILKPDKKRIPGFSYPEILTLERVK